MHASRYFFSLWPNPVVARQLQQIQARLPAGRLTHGADLHLTLAFLGEVSEADEVKLHHLLQAIPFSAFELVLDRLDAFRRIGLSWAGPSQIPLALQTLYDTFGAALDDQGIWWDKRLVFRPHVTLARKAVVPQQHLTAPVVWWADRIVLARSGAAAPVGQRYTILAQRYAKGDVRPV